MQGQTDSLHPLAEKTVLVDGLNLELAEGTGIKTYGQTLVRALRNLGASVHLLRSADISKHEIVQMALIHETHQWPSSRLRNRVSFGINVLRLLTDRGARCVGPLRLGHSVIPPSDDRVSPQLSGVVVSPDCFDLAHRMFRYLRKPISFNLAADVDIWHATYPIPIRLKNTCSITTIHDVIPLKLPWLSVDRRGFYARLVRDSIQSSDLIITVSEHSRNDICDMLDVSPERVHVTYQGYYAPERISDSASTDRFLNGLGLTRGAYALFVGAIEPKKNVRRLIHAYRLLRCDIPLLLVGRRAWLWQKELRGSRDLIRSGRVKIMEYVPRQVLNELYRGARFFVFPSIYEGFGLPPIEAMAHDCPVLVSNAASLPEVCGEAAIYCDPFDIENIAGQMELLLNDDSVRDSLIAKGRERLKMFSAERYQERLLDAYNAALGHRR